MKNLIKNILSQQFINNSYHLPKAVLANMIYGSPTRGMKVIGVTGTDGKTTTVNMIYQILKEAGKKVSMISTINAPGFHVTSPDPVAVQKFAKMAKDNRDEYLVLEVTSHGLDQYRFWGIKFDIGVITNITHEHLDYHKTFDHYLKTKFKLLKDVKSAVINRNLKKYIESNNLSSKEILTFGISSGDFNQERIKLKLKIPGDYNIENALCALAVAFALGIDRRIAQKVLESFIGIKGRMEEIGNNKGLKIIIDFAHTPNGLEQVLKTLRLQTQGRLISLIGCEGYRDEGKRAMMGEIAKKLSDFVIVTAVDPRGQLDIINKQIEQGAKKAGAKQDRNLFIIDDRKKAINFAINSLAKRGDTIGIFGKGHEQSMNLDGKKEISWSDSKVVEEVLG
ncbi:UDP-N-acetylmuramoyl-L-alanyl-D-glutamate--2,6-diaminopimelate ligase [Candidatus Daviesbacteria bacterium]|nr:UDP-N-acetylmuramoyl-L-alanyl-D-glutamate--2,6-diaminopimelate ligase [Candidatus Daviesbacteria bacterium]